MLLAINRRCLIFLLPIACAPLPCSAHDEESIAFFEKRIRPLLIQHCYECHSQKAKKLQAELYLDGRATMLKGGESGPAIVAGKPDESPLIQAVRYQSFEMPPKGKLPDDKISDLERWVEMGAPWPDEAKTQQFNNRTQYDWRKLQADHWAWHPVVKPSAAQVEYLAWPKSPIDHFILAALERAGMRPSPPADKRTLIRRAFIDLLGFPPSPQQVDAFENDDRADAFARLLDELLASPRYGERWGRHWLDVARYSDGLGGFLDSAALPHAYQFRDWVIRSLNRDLPYDEFVWHQIAGDLLSADQSLLGPGFFAIGPTYKSDGGDPDSVAQTRSETLDDRIDTLSRAFLGLTVACARCHDHKFDPIPTLDYYSLAGVFNNTKTVDVPVVPRHVVDEFKRAQHAIKGKEEQINHLRKKIEKTDADSKAAQSVKLKGLEQQLAELKKSAPARYPVAHTLADTGSADMQVALRGNLRKPGPVAPRRFLRILSPDEPAIFETGSGRIELAAAISNPENPLTARVMVNRIWMHHIGRALVRSPSNFGTLGQPPTHPRLLDWLAHEFASSGWSIKRLHRAIMLSATYHMSSRHRDECFQRDGDNRLVWRMNPRRMDVEAWRDSLLSVTGELDSTMEGAPTEELLETRRRTIYAKISRHGDRFQHDEFLRMFDFPAPRVTSAGRNTSTVPQQYLFMMNSPFMIDRAKTLAARLDLQAPDDASRVRLAYRLLFGREPNDQERQLGMAFVRNRDGNEQRKLSPWQQYCQVLLSSNEFMRVD